MARGRLLHHFASRDVLLVAASEHLAAQRVQDTTQRVTSELQHPRNDTDRVDLVIELMWASFHEPHYWAAVELWTAARTEDVIAEALLPRNAAWVVSFGRRSMRCSARRSAVTRATPNCANYS